MAVGVGVGVAVSVAVGVAVSVGVGVAVGVSVAVGVAVNTGVNVGVAVGVAVNVGVAVRVGVAVAVGVAVNVGVAVLVGVAVVVGVGVAADSSNAYVHVSAPSVVTAALISSDSRTHPPTTAETLTALHEQLRSPAAAVQRVAVENPAVQASLHCCAFVGAALDVCSETVIDRPACTAFVKYNDPLVRFAANSINACVPAVPLVALQPLVPQNASFVRPVVECPDTIA